MSYAHSFTVVQVFTFQIFSIIFNFILILYSNLLLLGISTPKIFSLIVQFTQLRTNFRMFCYNVAVLSQFSMKQFVRSMQGVCCSIATNKIVMKSRTCIN